MGGYNKSIARGTAFFGRFWRKSTAVTEKGKSASVNRTVRRKELMELCKKDLQQACYEHDQKLMQIGEVRLRNRIRTAATG